MSRPHRCKDIKWDKRFPMVGFRPLAVISAFIIATMCLALPLSAAEPVEIIVEGVEGDVLKNVGEALALPYGLVREGTVDRQWLERFRQQADETVRTAMEPFGYYNARVTVTIEEERSGEIRLRVSRGPGRAGARHGGGAGSAWSGCGGGVVEGIGGRLPPGQGRRAPAAEIRGGQRGAPLPGAGAGVPGRRFFGARNPHRKAHVHRPDPAGSGNRPAVFFRRDENRGGARLSRGVPAALSGVQARGCSSRMPGSGKHSSTSRTPNVSGRSISRRKKRSPREFRIPVLVQLKPGPSRSLRQGIGYGTDTGARFNVRYRDLNVLDRGHEFYSNLFTFPSVSRGWRPVTSCRTRWTSGVPPCCN